MTRPVDPGVPRQKWACLMVTVPWRGIGKPSKEKKRKLVLVPKGGAPRRSEVVGIVAFP